MSLYSPSTPRLPPQQHVVALSPFSPGLSDTPERHEETKSWQHLYVLPVLLLEFLALALTRAVLPSLLLEQYGDKVYLVMGCVDCIRGLLAFCSCPLFGKISDIVGRKLCLFVTVLGTCAPVSSLAFFSWDGNDIYEGGDTVMDAAHIATSEPFTVMGTAVSNFHPRAISVFIVLLAISGIFSSTFTLVFAYISDTVPNREERVSAYGLALATFGLAFTIGPMAGGYLAKSSKQYVFLASLLLTALDLLYIYLVLPESRQHVQHQHAGKSSASVVSFMLEQTSIVSWNPVDTMRLIATDPFLRAVGKVAFLYYTGLWALISTLSVYAVQRFHMSPERLGELMSALGLSTMVAEAVLVRLFVPLLGEKRAIQIGLVSFALQCIVLGFAYEGWHLFVCAMFSLLGNLVYPALSSLVSSVVEPEAIGEALGAVNGIKALTEGIGPLVFGTLMTLSEGSALPGWPYLLASVLAAAAYKATSQLPGEEDEDYIHELVQAKLPNDGIWMRTFGPNDHGEEEEFEGLLSEIEEESDSDR